MLALLAAPAAARVAERRLDELPLVETIAIEAKLDHVQGIDVRDGLLWISSVDRGDRRGWLHRIKLPSGRPLGAVEVRRGERYHPGGVALAGESIWVPVAEYRPRSTTTIQRRHAETLALEQSFDVADHIGCIAALGDRLIGGNWDSELLYAWKRDGAEISRRRRRTATRFQDLKSDRGLLVGSGLVSREQGAVEWLSPLTYTPRRRILAGKTDRGVLFTHEGMAIRDGRLYLLPEDGPSRLFVFELPVWNDGWG